MEEYLADLWGGGEDGEAEPEWVEEERRQFKEFRDKNGDGKLDRQEVEDWILPQDFDHSDVSHFSAHNTCAIQTCLPLFQMQAKMLFHLGGNASSCFRGG